MIKQHLQAIFCHFACEQKRFSRLYPGKQQSFHTHFSMEVELFNPYGIFCRFVYSLQWVTRVKVWTLWLSGCFRCSIGITRWMAVFLLCFASSIRPIYDFMNITSPHSWRSFVPLSLAQPRITLQIIFLLPNIFLAPLWYLRSPVCPLCSYSYSYSYVDTHDDERKLFHIQKRGGKWKKKKSGNVIY